MEDHHITQTTSSLRSVRDDSIQRTKLHLLAFICVDI